jgi:hypothetical protein
MDQGVIAAVKARAKAQIAMLQLSKALGGSEQKVDIADAFFAIKLALSYVGRAGSQTRINGWRKSGLRPPQWDDASSTSEEQLSTSCTDEYASASHAFTEVITGLAARECIDVGEFSPPEEFLVCPEEEQTLVTEEPNWFLMNMPEATTDSQDDERTQVVEAANNLFTIDQVDSDMLFDELVSRAKKNNNSLAVNQLEVARCMYINGA